MKNIFAILLFGLSLYGQPQFRNNRVDFDYSKDGSTIILAGDFNGWSRVSDTLKRMSSGHYIVSKTLKPGIYEYKFIVDGKWLLDPENPAQVANYDNSDFNSVFTLTEMNKILFQGYMPTTNSKTSDVYPSDNGTLYLNIIWHQHQPLYLDPASDQLQGPWVRTHGTKDYYDMAAILEKYPNIHYNVNLTSSMLYQLQEYYVNRLGPYIDLKKNRVDAQRFLAKWKGKTDPWIDLALQSTAKFSAKDITLLLHNVWNAFGISEVQIRHFPEYAELKAKAGAKKKLNEQELRNIKFWFYLAHFDPDFLEVPVRLPDETIVDVTDLIEKKEESKYYLKKKIAEEDCNRIIAETYKILSNVIPIHRKLMYNRISHDGQIEIATTPFYHPILPLIYNSDLAKICQPTDQMPKQFSYPQDADIQVAKAVEFYKKYFGQPPVGMWPGEGSVAHDIIPIFGKNGIRWIATDEKILSRSKPNNQPKYYPYAVFAHHTEMESVVVVFRDTELSDKIGFTYQNYLGEDAADDFIKSILQYSPKKGETDRLLTVILDGENAWEWYRRDIDGKEFLNALYRKLSALFETRQVVTVTMTEYLDGNPKRDIPAHPILSLPKLDWLYPGSWINANYDTWIGEDEENKAWEYLLIAREDMAKSGIPQPDPKLPVPVEYTKAWYEYHAWEEIYAAEGSDWFWWYGTDQTAPSGDKPFDIAYITHLKNIYTFAKKAGAIMPERDFKPIIVDDISVTRSTQGTMAKSQTGDITVLFQCDARDIYVRKGVYIVGNHQLLGEWKPNTIKMYDDGSHGDQQAGDSIWTIELKFPIGTELLYKYTNSGPHGEWNPGEEFPSSNRRIILNGKNEREVLVDTFGKL